MTSDPQEDERGGLEAIAARTAANFSALAAAPLAGGLYLVATPIGNLGDITVRALSVLARADVVYCEDTRHSRTLLAHYAIKGPLRPYHEHNADEQRPRVLRELAEGKAIALISDAGTPLISDPGFKLAREASAAGHAVVAVPGASAALAALSVSGLPTDAFHFAGFLPPREAARQARIGQLASVEASLVFYEAPTRLRDTLADLAAVLGPRQAAVARELTKLFEDVQRGTLPDLLRHYAEHEPKGEIVIVVGPPGEEALGEAAIEAKLLSALETMSVRDAAKVVAEALKLPKARIYDMALGLKSRDRSL